MGPTLMQHNIQDLAGPRKNCTAMAPSGDPAIDFTSWPFIVFSIVALLATAVSFASISLHCTNWRKPAQQIWICIVLAIVPVYSLLSWAAFSLFEGRTADNVVMVRDCYDAVIVFAFYRLLLNYIAPTTDSQKSILASKPASKIPLLPPYLHISINPATPHFLSRNTLLVLQFVFVKFSMTLFSLVFQLELDNCADATNLKYGNPWYLAAQFISLPVAMLGILFVYHPVREDVGKFFVVKKFVAVKGMILFGFLQDMILLLLIQSGSITLQNHQAWTLTRIEAFLMSIEMLVLSAILVVLFSYREYAKDEAEVTEVYIDKLGDGFLVSR
ncbi:hypothetical protein HDU98_001012 [Podochytrium sp. JEL0797]|nr:hypothetical protein HDU98_001012 [Podochytrium sp. JEL0797]